MMREAGGDSTGDTANLVMVNASNERALHPYMDPKREVTKALPGMHLVHKRKLLSDEGRKLTECEAHMRPANKFEGKKEGYYFTTGFRGTGYYLDTKWCDYNDPDERGYVLVRTAPAVAVKRAIRKREALGVQGLLFSTAFLEALGPAHGTPGHRYKLVTPLWLCGMRPPQEKFEKKAEVALAEVAGQNELLAERLERMASKLASLPSISTMQYAAPRPARVKARRGAIVRKDVSLSSEPVGEVAFGTAVIAVEEAKDVGGASRTKIVEPARGWLSTKTLDFTSGLDSTSSQGTIAPLESMLVVETRGGPLTLRGDDLEPVIPGPGPWTIELALGGPDARDKPLVIKVTLKNKSLATWPATKLLDVFAKQHDAKYGGRCLDATALRLHEQIDDTDFVHPQTRLAEIVKDWSAPLCARLVVKRKLGADDAKPIVFPREKEIEDRLRKEGPVITEWSSHLDVMQARLNHGYDRQPQTSAEIQQYWEDRKHDKHWRTTAALKGYSTGTEDRDKLRLWTNSLQPKSGFLHDNSRKALYEAPDCPESSVELLTPCAVKVTLDAGRRCAIEAWLGEGNGSGAMFSTLNGQSEASAPYMVELPWPDWPSVSILERTNFNTFVKPRDNTKRIIAATLRRMPYSVVRRPPPPVLPDEIAARKLARIKRILQQKFPLDNAKLKTLKERMETVPNPSGDVGTAVLAEPGLNCALPGETKELGAHQSQFTPSVMNAVATQVLLHAKEQSGGVSSVKQATASKLKDSRSVQLYANTPCTPQPIMTVESKVQKMSTAEKPHVAVSEASPTRSKTKFQDDVPTPAHPAAAATTHVRPNAQLTRENMSLRALQLRLAAFIDREAEHDPRFPTDDKIVHRLDVESEEMRMRQRAVLEVEMTGELHHDKLNSTLAEPLDSAMVYCGPDALKAHPNATVSFTQAQSSETHDERIRARPNTQHLRVAQQLRKAMWQRTLGEDAKTRGDTSAAYKHFEAAASLYADGAFEGKPEVDLVEATDVFVYTNEAHLAAICVQRNFRRHLRNLSAAITRFKAIFRGTWQRNKNTETRRREVAAATFLQGPIRRWARRRISKVIQMQTRWRGVMGRRAARERRHERALSKLLIFFAPIFRRWLHRCRRKRRDLCARSLQHSWKGYKIRTARSKLLASQRKAKFDASSVIQGLIRCKGARRQLNGLREEALNAEALRSAAELYWLRGAYHVTVLRASESHKLKGGQWPIKILSQSIKRNRRKSSREDKVRAAFQELDIAGFGTLGYHEAAVLLKAEGVLLQEESMAATLVSLDPTMSGRVSLDVLQQWLEAYREESKAGCISKASRTFRTIKRCFNTTRMRFRDREKAKRDLTLRELRVYSRRVLADFRSTNPPAFECPACRYPFALFTAWWHHFDNSGYCAFDSPMGETCRLLRLPANPFANKLNVSTVAFLDRAELAELTRQFDEQLALEHAAASAKLLSHHLHSKNSKEKRDFIAIASFLRRCVKETAGRRLQLRVNAISLRIARKVCFLNCSDSEVADTKDWEIAFVVMDVNRHGGLHYAELSVLLFALITDWTCMPLPGVKFCEEAERVARSAAVAALEIGKLDAITWTDFVTWLSSDGASTVRAMLDPGRLYRKITAYIIADALCKSRAQALARQKELSEFRILNSPRRSSDGSRDSMLHEAGLHQLTAVEDHRRCAKIDITATHLVRYVDRIISMHRAHVRRFGFADERVIPTEHTQPQSSFQRGDSVGADGRIPRPYRNEDTQLDLGLHFQFDWLLRPSQIAQNTGTDSRLLVEDTICRRIRADCDLDGVEKYAEACARVSLHTRGVEIAAAAEHIRCDAIIRHMAALLQEAKTHCDDVLKAKVKCALAALPYVFCDGFDGFVDKCDLHSILHRELRLSRSSVDTHEVFDVLKASLPGFVELKEFLQWYASIGKEKHESCTSLQSCRRPVFCKLARYLGPIARVQYGRRVIKCRERGISRSDLWCSMRVNSNLFGIRRILLSRLRWQSIAMQQDVLKAQAVFRADRASKRFLQSRICRQFLKREAFHCASLHSHFFGMAKACTQAKMAATKQAEYIFTWFDIDGDGILSTYMLADVLRYYGIALDKTDKVRAVYAVAGSTDHFKWTDLQAWLLGSSWTKVQARLARGWIVKRSNFRRDAIARVLIAGRQKALSQLDVALALERKWHAVRECANMQRTAWNKDHLELRSHESSRNADPFDAALLDTLEFCNAYYRQRVGPYDGGYKSQRARSVSHTERNDVHRETRLLEVMLAHSEDCVRKGVERATQFAKEYCRARLEVKAASDTEEPCVVYDDEAYNGAAKPNASNSYSYEIASSELSRNRIHWFNQTRLVLL